MYYSFQETLLYIHCSNSILQQCRSNTLVRLFSISWCFSFQYKLWIFLDINIFTLLKCKTCFCNIGDYLEYSLLTLKTFLPYEYMYTIFTGNLYTNDFNNK